MKAGEYDMLASRTEADTPLIDRINAIQSIGPQGNFRMLHIDMSTDLVHGILGLAGELQELQRLGDGRTPCERSEIMKEIGDAWWYARMIFRSFDLDIGRAALRVATKIMQPNQEPDFILSVDRLTEPLKKWLFYGKPINEEELLKEAIEGLAHASIHDDELSGAKVITPLVIEKHLDEVWTLNIEKLQRRYPGRFDAALAQNHDSN